MRNMNEFAEKNWKGILSLFVIFLFVYISFPEKSLDNKCKVFYSVSEDRPPRSAMVDCDRISIVDGKLNVKEALESK